MELNETKALVRVHRPGPYSLYNYFTDAPSTIKHNN